MERSELAQLRRRARTRYERSRVRLALTHALLALPPMLLALLVWSRPGLTLVLSALLFAAIGLAVFRGRDAARGATAGVIAGSVPLLGLVLAPHLGHLCSGGFCMSMCVPVCFAGGALAGGYLAWRSIKTPGSAVFWAVAGVIGSVTAAMGCIPMGLGATAGMAAGFAIAAVPGLALARLGGRG